MALNFIRKLLYLLHINPKFIANLKKPKKLVVSDEIFNNARCQLNEIYPDAKTSCLAQNEIDKQVDVHIIVPAYNVEKYIEECIDSIIKPVKKITYLLTIVDDGSTDSTSDIISEYQNMPNVEIIKQENRGLSGARNRGLKTIKGKYVFFLDSDDLAVWDSIEKCYIEAEEKQADIVIGRYYYIKGDGSIEKSIKNPIGSGFAWGKLFKAEVFQNICFPEKYWFEDSLINHFLRDTVKNIVYCPEYVYKYRTNFEGITNIARSNVKSIDSLYITLALYEDRIKY